MTKEKVIKETTEVNAQGTTEVKVLTAEERLAEISSHIVTLNKAIKDNDGNARKSAEEKLDECIANYNEFLRNKEYDKWLAQENPVLVALKQGAVTQLKKKLKKGKDGAVDKFETAETWAVADLLEMNEYAGERKIFVSGQWIHRISAWNIALKAYKSADLADTDAVSKFRTLIAELKRDEDVAVEFKFDGKISKSLLKKTGQIICDNIVSGVLTDDKGNEKPFIFEGQDVEFVALGFKASNKDILKYAGMKDATCIKLFTRAMHRIVTGGTYKAEELNK